MCWNVRGIMSSAYALSDMLDKNDIDIGIISEHKLFNHSKSFLDSINPKYKSFSVCDSSIDQYGPAKCGKGGVAILYKKSLQSSISLIDCLDNERIIGIELKLINSERIYIIGVYMPSDSYIKHYHETITELEAITHTCSLKGKVLILGDFNARLRAIGKMHDDVTSDKSSSLQQFMANNRLIALHHSDQEFTYVRNRSKLDHILIEQTLINKIEQYKTLPEKDVFTSDHLPLIASLNVTKQKQVNLTDRKCIAWDKCNACELNSFENTLSQYLSSLTFTSKMDPNQLSDFIVSSTLKSAENCLPKGKFNKHTKPYWSRDLRQAHAESRRLRRIWINIGRPRGVEYESYQRYKSAKRNFRRKQRIACNLFLNKTFEELDKAAHLDVNLFWKLVKRKKKNVPNVCAEIIYKNVTYAEENVSNGFSEFFKDTFDFPETSEDYPFGFTDKVNSLVKQFMNDNSAEQNDTFYKVMIAPFTRENVEHREHIYLRT